MRYALIVIILLTLGGCLSPVTSPENNLYVLNPGKLMVPKDKKSNKTLLVMATDTSDQLATKKMAYVNQPYQLAYFTKNKWAAEPANQLTSLITQALRQTQYFKAVVQTPFVGVTDLKLNTTLTSLQQNFLFNPSRAQFVLSAQLVNANSGKIIAEKTFHYAIPTKSNDPYAGVVAYNLAVKKALQKLALFVVQSA